MQSQQYDADRNMYRPGSQAIVVGSGIAGLSAARVLVKYYRQIIVIDRDWLPDEPVFRSGIPQAHHAHTLLPYGQMILEKLFPGIVEQLLDEGAETIDDENETAYFESGIWQKPKPGATRPTISSSRPLLECLLYRRVSDLPQVKILAGFEATDLTVDEDHHHVTGITARRRQFPGESPVHFPADLVVDASGRNSKAPQWLESLGFIPPDEWRINSHAGYASRIYCQPEGYPHTWKKLYIGPCPPDGLRGGVIVPLEGKRWHVTLIGLAGDFPPTDETGFVEFARSLPVPELYEAIQAAEPLSRITGFRKTENRVRRFENLPSYLEGLLVLGDAVFTMNPIYALGMTAAVASSQVLDQVLARGKLCQAGLASAFQKRLAARMATLWRQAVQGDWLWPATDISDNTETLHPLVGYRAV
jgi:2-polyprenyl-6-methoxyphenol hydroxylase-like FAD-dependent oxidoreductase